MRFDLNSESRRRLGNKLIAQLVEFGAVAVRTRRFDVIAAHGTHSMQGRSVRRKVRLRL